MAGTSESPRTQADDSVYEALAARRLQWDSLLWQVPVLGLTAQAFLFTIALDPASSRLARMISSSRSVVATLMCMQLMASDRRAEVADAHWLSDIEAETGRVRIHGRGFRDRRTPRTLM